MAAAASRADGAAAKAAASAAAFDRNLDLVVQIGWASMEKFCYSNFLKVRGAGRRMGAGGGGGSAALALKAVQGCGLVP